MNKKPLETPVTKVSALEHIINWGWVVPALIICGVFVSIAGDLFAGPVPVTFLETAGYPFIKPA